MTPKVGDFVRLPRWNAGKSEKTLTVVEVSYLGDKWAEVFLPGRKRARVRRVDIDALAVIEPTDAERAALKQRERKTPTSVNVTFTPAQVEFLTTWAGVNGQRNLSEAVRAMLRIAAPELPPDPPGRGGVRGARFEPGQRVRVGARDGTIERRRVGGYQVIFDDDREEYVPQAHIEVL